MEKSRQEKLEELSQASPLEISKQLKEFELYDKKSSQKIIDEVYEEFENGEDMTESLIKPIFMSIIDGVLESTSFGKKARKKGLSTSRIINECENFKYNEQTTENNIDSYNQYKNAREYTKEYGKENRNKYDRNRYESKYSMKKYKEKAIEENNGNKLLRDEYQDEKNIYPYQNNPDQRRNDDKYDYQAEPDHIVPLKKIHKKFKGNYALSDTEIKDIANIDDNLAITSGELNGKKLDCSNSEFIKKQEKLKKQGKEYFEIDDETKERLIQTEKDAQKKVDSKANKSVINNLKGKGTLDRDTKKSAYKKLEKEKGRKLTKKEKCKVNRDLKKRKSKKIYGKASHDAVKQAKDYAVGNIILFFVKPLYFEIKDIFKNGVAKGGNKKSTVEALKIRFGRVKKHVIANGEDFIGDNLWEFIKGFISSLIEGIISLFVGIFKQVFKLIKEGIQVFVKSSKVLFGKDAQDKTASEKGDAIIKILGGSVIAIAGIGIEALLNRMGIGEPWSIILSTILSGIASALFMFLLDKADLFSAKAEKRKNRIEEIFDKRIKDIENATNNFNIVAIETLKKQRIEFDTINSEIVNGLNNNNINNINNGLDKMAEFFDVKLPYNNLDEFVDYFDSDEALNL